MAVYFLDSSAAVKLYVQETGTRWLYGLKRAQDEPLIVARIAAAEIAAALYRRVHGGTLSRENADTAVRLMQASFEHYL